MMVKYGALARQNGVTVVSSAGFDVVPAETLLQFLENKFGGCEISIIKCRVDNYKT